MLELGIVHIPRVFVPGMESHQLREEGGRSGNAVCVRKALSSQNSSEEPAK